MVRFLIIPVIFLHYSCLGQKVISPDKIWEKCLKLYQQGKLDSVKPAIVFFKDYNNLIGEIKWFYVCTDTITYDDGFYGIGKVILDPLIEFHNRKIGTWTIYYPSGKIYSTGNYNIGAFTQCQAGGPNLVGYSFKSGNWKYWYNNTILMTEGVYEPVQRLQPTSCSMDTINITNVTLKWNVYDSTGNTIKNKSDLIEGINNGH